MDDLQPPIEEEEVPAPQFDRSTKPHKLAPPSDMQQRDFQPVWADVVSIYNTIAIIIIPFFIHC